MPLFNRAIETEIRINASPSAVWNVLIDFQKFPEWNTFMIHATLPAAHQGSTLDSTCVGKYVEITMQTNPITKQTRKFSPILLRVDDSKELRWRGVFASSYLFQGEHYFLLSEESDSKGGKVTKLTHGELFSGLLIPVLGSVIDETKINFQRMNEDLKKRVEEGGKGQGQAQAQQQK